MSKRAPRCTCDVSEDPTCPVCNPPAAAPSKITHVWASTIPPCCVLHRVCGCEECQAPLPAVSSEETRPLEVIASYVLGGWSRQARTDSELLSAIRAGCEVSPIAEVTVRPYYSPEEKRRWKADHDALDGRVESRSTPEQRLISIQQSVRELEQAAKVK